MLFFKNVKDHNIALETPKFSPNALNELEQNVKNFEVESIETLVNPEDNPHHWLQTDILRIQNFLYHYFKDSTLNDQTIPQIKVISLFLRKYFRFNYQLLWSQQDQPAFTAFPNHFTADECLPFIISEQNEHPYFLKPQSITKQTLDYMRFDHLLITENDIFADNRPYHYEQNSQAQQNLNFEDDTTSNENTLQQQNQDENYNNNEFTTQESTISTQNTSQARTSTSTHTQSFRVPTTVVNQRQNTHNTQSHLDTSPNCNITFNLQYTDETTHDETHDTIHEIILTTSHAQNTSVNVASPTKTIPDSTRYITRSRYDPPSIPSAFRSDRSISSNNNCDDNPQTSNQYYDPFNYNFYPPSNTNNNTNINQNHSQITTTSTTQNPFIQLSHTSTSQNVHSKNQGTSYPSTSYFHTTQSSQKRLQNPPLTHIPTDPVYQMHPNPNPNPNPNPLPQNTTQHIPPHFIQQLAPPLQYVPIPQDTFMNMSASIPEPMKPFDGLDHSYTPEEYLQQVEARLTFAIGEEPQNNPIKYKSWHNRRMACIQCSIPGTALDWYTNLHISYKQQWNSFVQLFKKQFSSQKTAYHAQVEAMSLMKKDKGTVRNFALRVQQLVKKGWCNKNAAIINLKNNEIFTKGLPKKLKDFAHKRQVKHVSTLLEHSIPIPTLVRHVDSEDIANEITIETIKTQQKQDTVFQKVYQWLLNNERPLQIDPTIAANSFLLVFYKIFNQLYINHDTKIIHIDYPNLHDSNPNQRDKICLPFKLFHAAFNKLHAHGHSGIKISIKAFNQFYFIPYLNKWMSIFIHDCIECQQNKHINQKIQTASIQTFSEKASYFNNRISMDTKGPINPPSNQNSYIHVIVDAFSHFVVTVPIKQNYAQNAVNSLLHHWITKFRPAVYLVTDRGTDYINSEFSNLCTTMGIRHSPRTPYAPWTNGLVENQNRNLGTHLRLFLHNTPENWSTQVHMYAYAHNSQPISEMNLSPYEIVFHTIPRIPINFELNLQRDTYRNCTSQYCQKLPLHTHYDKSNLNPFFHKILSKATPQWILAS